MPFTFNLQDITLVTGVLYVLMAVTVWVMLLRRHNALRTVLWSAGSLAGGVGLLLIQPRSAVPSWVIDHAAMFIMIWSLVLRTAALQLGLGMALPTKWLAAAGLAGMAAYEISMWLPSFTIQITCGTLLLVVGNLALGWYARALGVSTPSRSGMLLAWSEVAAAAGLLNRLVLVLEAGTEDMNVREPWQFALLMSLGAIAAIYANLGYLGIALDQHRAAEAQARQASAAARADRDSARLVAADLRVALAQREALMDERDHLLQLLAHEIRQPLHNASGALQVLRRLLLGPEVTAPLQQAAEPLRRAEGVLGDVHSVLDNTLAAAMLINQATPALQEVELAMVVNLALGDLDLAQRAAVTVQYDTDLRSAEFEPGLIRLALRNLLRNALQHGGSAVQVTLRVAERLQPPALLLSVSDNGPGMAPSRPGQRKGLGLGIVDQVARLHGGLLALDQHPTGGLEARLMLPLPGLDGGAH